MSLRLIDIGHHRSVDFLLVLLQLVVIFPTILSLQPPFVIVIF
jgi:hypothetical protein